MTKEDLANSERRLFTQSEAMQKSAAGQQIVSEEAEETRAADHKVEPEESAGNAKGQESVTVRSNPYNPANFSYLDEISENIAYFDENYESLQGIDVSDHQGEIDWQAVADAGYEFVFVRVGFRGYGAEGTLNEDMKRKPRKKRCSPRT